MDRREPGAARDPAERVAAGLAARRRVELGAHAEYLPAADRADPVAVLSAQADSRLPELADIRYGRMLLTPFTFYRGAVAVMAADLAATPVSGLTVQLCGDAHLSNFGLFASPERRLLFDANDFDETCPGPWEWDLKRLVASLVVAGRENGFGRKYRAAVVLATVAGYRRAMARFAGMGELSVWYARADVDEVGPLLVAQLGKARGKRIGRMSTKARTRDSLRASRRLTTVVDGHRRIAADPPLIVPVEDLLDDTDRDALQTRLSGMFDRYRSTLAVDRRRLFDAFSFVHLARKVVGVGSVGTRCWVALLRGRDLDDPLLLQIKEAQPAVNARHLGIGKAAAGWDGEGERVVSGQRLIQAASDIFLGWSTIEGIDGRTRDFYVRQLRDWKGSATIEDLDPVEMRVYSELCGWTLARAHARTGDRIAIAAYVGESTALDEALVQFGEAYADQTERDHAALAEAVRTGRLEARPGV